MRFEVFQAIRDSSLNHKEKTFLFVTESRGTDGMFSTWERNAADMGMGRDMYYRTRNDLIESGHLIARRRMDGTTVYLVDTDSVFANARSRSANRLSHSAKGHSQEPETKKNTKKNMKNNFEEQPDSASAPSVTGQEIDRESFSGLNEDDVAFLSGPTQDLGDSDSANEPVSPEVVDLRRRLDLVEW